MGEETSIGKTDHHLLQVVGRLPATRALFVQHAATCRIASDQCAACLQVNITRQLHQSREALTPNYLAIQSLLIFL